MTITLALALSGCTDADMASVKGRRKLRGPAHRVLQRVRLTIEGRCAIVDEKTQLEVCRTGQQDCTSCLSDKPISRSSARVVAPTTITIKPNRGLRLELGCADGQHIRGVSDRKAVYASALSPWGRKRPCRDSASEPRNSRWLAPRARPCFVTRGVTEAICRVRLRAPSGSRLFPPPGLRLVLTPLSPTSPRHVVRKAG